MTYYVWKANPEGSFCTLEGIQNLDNPWELSDGKRYGDTFPKDAAFHMNPAFPKDIALADNIYNLRGVVVVSGRLKAFVEGLQPPAVEYLPVTLYNHKGRVASTDYYVLNPYQIVDCIDLEASDIVWNSISPDTISSCYELVLDEERIDEALLLFRLPQEPTVVLVAEPLVKALEAEGFTGLYFTPSHEAVL